MAFIYAIHKYSKLVNGDKEIQRTNQWLPVGRGKGQYRGGDEEVQTVTYKISYKDITREYSQHFITTINGDITFKM